MSNTELVVYRERLGRQGVVPDWISRMHAGNLTKGVEQNISNARNIRESIRRLNDLVPSEMKTPRGLATIYTANEVSGVFQDSANLAFRIGQYPAFITYFDLSWGAVGVSGLMLFADERLRGENELMAKSVEQVNDIHDELDPAHKEHNVYSEVSDMSQNAVSVLREDLSGMLLVDEVLKYIKGVPNRISSNEPYSSVHLRDLVEQGAEISAHAYRVSYPIAREILGDK